MDDPMVALANKLTSEIERFLRACKADGDTTIDDVLKRLNELRKPS